MINKSLVTKNIPVYFDVERSDHRSAARTFFKTGNWQHTNLRFVVELPWVDVPNTLQNKLLNYYFSLDKETS